MTASNPSTLDSSHDFENLFKIYEKCKRKSYYKNGRPRPCRSQRCPCEACRSQYAKKEASILLRSFKDKPPTHAFVLKLVDEEPTIDVQMGRYLNAFTQHIRDHRKITGTTIEYEIRLEFKSGEPHAHGIFITPLGWSREEIKELVRGWWESSCSGRSTLAYADRVRTVVGIGKYSVKDLKDRRGVEMPPQEWNGRKCRFVRRSQHFLTKSKQQLWQDQCEEWYPTKAESVSDLIDQGVGVSLAITEAPGCVPARVWQSRWGTGRPAPLRAVPAMPRRARNGFWSIWRDRGRPTTRGP